MKNDLRAYLLAVCLPALLITGAGLVFLQAFDRRDRERVLTETRTQVDVLAGILQETLREAGPSNDVSRTLALQTWHPAELVLPIRGRFIWEMPGRLLWEETLPDGLTVRLQGMSRWNEWTSEGKRNARRGLMPIQSPGGGVSFQVLWCRLGNSVAGVVFDGYPLVGVKALNLWPVGLAALSLLCGIVILAGGALCRAATRARRIDGMKTTFLSNTSHELKTPLAAIGLWAEMLRNGRLSDEKREHAYEVIAEENGRMIRLVEELLEFSRLEQKRRVYRLGPVDLTEAARAAVDLLQGRFERHGVYVRGEEGIEACADADAVRQILVNLLSNAAKYAAADGPVDVVVQKGADGVSVEVRDRGPGLSAQARKRVFERFYRQEEALESKTEGLGLGLSISRALAREMDGDLTVAARPGGGCVFTLRLKS